MLDERDQRALTEIQRQLAADDPAFARRMGAGNPFPTVSALCVTVFLALPFVAMFLGPATALVTAHLTALAVTVVLVCRHLRGP